MTRRILLVEDNPGDALLTRRAFANAKSDYVVEVVEDASAARAHLEAAVASDARPDLILLDVNLPGTSGHAVCQWIKQHATLKTCPTLMLTSSASPTDIERAYENHANSYFTKPLTFSELRLLVQNIESYWFDWVRTATPV